ncbi:hypothetical protein LG284_01060 [Citricoccus nitrophenolicus]
MDVARWQSRLDDVRRAVEQLRDACATDGDARRASTAAWLEGLFAEVTSANELRQSAQQALALYAGGMGSFQDVGSATMAAAVATLRSTLRVALSAHPWDAS